MRDGTIQLSVCLCFPPASLSVSSCGNTVNWRVCQGGCVHCARPFFMNELINGDTALHAFSFLIILISRLYGCPPSLPPLLHFINTLTCTWQKEQGHRHSGGGLASHFVVSRLSCPLCPPRQQAPSSCPALSSAKQLLGKSSAIIVELC